MPTLLFKVIAYHLALIGFLVGALHFVPQVEPYLPVGGLFSDPPGSITEVFSAYRIEFESEAVYTGLARLTYALVMSISLVSTQLVMLPIAWVYRATNSNRQADKYVAETLFILPIVITAIVLIIRNNLALAFGLAGIVAGVQYRNRLKRPTDAAFLFAAIAVGISSGIQAIGVAIVMSLWFCVSNVVLRLREQPENPG